MRKMILLLSMAFACMSMVAGNPDMIVTQNGESIQAYNLDDSGAYYYYSLTEEVDAPIKKIAKKDVLIIKKSDGTKIDPQENTTVSAQTNGQALPKNPDAHESVTVDAIEPDFVAIHMKKQKKDPYQGTPELPERDEYFVSAADKDGHVLKFRLLSKEDKTLAVTKNMEIVEKDGKIHKKDKRYEEPIYIIPEYVRIGNTVYTVTEIDYSAFESCRKVTEVVFPNTLKTIRPYAFAYSVIRGNLKRIVLPEGLETIGKVAFWNAAAYPFEQLYIPKSVKEIGADAFLHLGSKKSYRGFTQCNITSLPDFVTVGNCTSYGIDEEAVEDYQRRNSAR